MVVVRENTEGMYSGIEFMTGKDFVKACLTDSATLMFGSTGSFCILYCLSKLEALYRTHYVRL